MPCLAAAPRAFLQRLFDAAVAAADPMAVVPPHLPPREERSGGRLVVLGAGKASARMAQAVEQVYGPCEGLVITRYGHARPCDGVEIVEAGHPVPDAVGEAASARMLALAHELGAGDTVIALISGGGSALLCAPAEGMSLAEKIALNQALLDSGAPIGEMNIVRKHLSRVKGGQLAAACAPARVISLLISDVPGDDPALIASGPTVGDGSTMEEAAAILQRYGIAAPLQCLAGSGVVAPGDARLSRTDCKIVAAPQRSLEAAAKLARAAGCEVEILGDALEGEARKLGAAQARDALARRKTRGPASAPLLLLSGGECTVTRQGTGIGGPNAEFVLSALTVLDGTAGCYVLAGDTDGIDGAAPIAGACCGPDTPTTGASQALSQNDAHSFFGKTGGQIITGPTFTNVNDFRAILILPPGC